MADVTALAQLHPAAAPSRWVGLDRLRGLAVLLMVIDHACVVAGAGELYRLSLGRVAMPLFFLVAGAVVRAPRPRWALIALTGVLLPVVVPWLDSPNVLVLYVLGALLVWFTIRFGVPPWVLVLPALLFMANGWNVNPGNGFDVLAAVALMGLGASCLPVRTAGARLPSWLASLGRYPLSLYVGHLLVLRGVQLVLS